MYLKSKISVKKQLHNNSVILFVLILSVSKFLPRFKTAIFFLLLFKIGAANGQVIISGTVYDSTKIFAVPGVIVKSTGGKSAITDSLGAYHIGATEKDSLSFYYNNKPTQKFAISKIANYNDFDISLQVHVFEKFRLLKEVKVFSKLYKQDSAENRQAYSKIFNYQKPGIKSTYSPGMSAGFDLDELINIFHFRRNKMNLAFQKRLIDEEQDKYVDYKFNNTLLKRVTGLSDESLEKYKREYKPPYEFVTTASELEFYEYILKSSAQFKMREGISLTPAKN